MQQGDSDPQQEPEEKCYLWPENVRTYNVWFRIQTQWRVGGMGDRTGLDYSAVEKYLHKVERIRPGRQRNEVWAGLQAMEAAALQAWSEKREQQAE